MEPRGTPGPLMVNSGLSGLLLARLDGKINDDPWGRVGRSGALFFWEPGSGGLASLRSIDCLDCLSRPLTVPLLER